MTNDQKIIKHKVGLIIVAAILVALAIFKHADAESVLVKYQGSVNLAAFDLY